MTQEILALIGAGLGATPADLKGAWEGDPDAQQVGRLEARPSGREFTGLSELIVIPIVVGVSVKVGGDVITEIIKRLLAAKVKEPVAVEQQTLPNGQQAIVVQKK